MTHKQLLHRCWLACGAIVMVASMPFAAGANDAGMLQPPRQGMSGETDRLIVKYRDARPAGRVAAQVLPLDKRRKAIIDRAGQQFGISLSPLHSIATGANVLKLDRKMPASEVEALAAELAQRDPDVEYAEPDRIVKAAFVPNDPYYPLQWNYFEAAGGLRLPAAWDLSTGAGVNVAVLDSGYRPHADLAGQFVQGYDFIADLFHANDGDGRDSDARDPGDAALAGECGNGLPTSDQPSSWHGTHVSGIVAALTNNLTGVAGVAFGAKIVPVRVLGKCGGYTSDLVDGIIWAVGGPVSGAPPNANRARVINMSLGGASKTCGAALQNAINIARSRDAVLVVAAGNEATDAGGVSPANCAGVITVAAVGRDGGQTAYSNFGGVVDVAAPGGVSGSGNGILSTLNSGTTTPGLDTYAYYIGTSMAAPHVAGVAALMLSRNPFLTPDEVETRIKLTARAFAAPCASCGAGIVDAAAAVTAAGAPAWTTQNEAEPNGSIASANVVPATRTVILGRISSPNDDDYFSVSLPPGHTLTASLEAQLSTVNYDLFVYDSSGRLLTWSLQGAGCVDTVTNRNNGSVNTTRYVRVRYTSGLTGFFFGAYRLTLTW